MSKTERRIVILGLTLVGLIVACWAILIAVGPISEIGLTPEQKAKLRAIDADLPRARKADMLWVRPEPTTKQEAAWMLERMEKAKRREEAEAKRKWELKQDRGGK